jgi:hypothetical protein
MKESVWINGGMLLTGENICTVKKEFEHVCDRLMNEY